MMPGMQGVPIMVLKEGTRRDEGRNALEQNIGAGVAIAKTVRTTLGPKGMDKMLVDSMGDTIITNDGVTILKEIDVQHPAAKMVVEAAKTQDDECGDGTTTAVILIGELLEQALPLIKKNIHPTVICDGYHMALEEAKQTLADVEIRIGNDMDNEETRQTLAAISNTSMTGKHTSEYKTLLTAFVISIIASIATGPGANGKYKVDLDNVKVVKQKGKSVEESEVLEGLIINRSRLSKSMPLELTDPTIALFSCPVGGKGTGAETSMQFDSAERMKEMLNYEEEKVAEIIQSMVDAGVDVVITSKQVSDDAIAAMESAGILATSRVPEDDLDRISKISGAPILSNVKNLTSTTNTRGFLSLIEEKKINGDPQLAIHGLKNESSPVRTVLLRGASDHVLDEIERGFHDAITTTSKAYEDGVILVGGGSAFAEISRSLLAMKDKIESRESYAIEAFAKACEAVPLTLSENAGLDPINTEISLRKAHAAGNKYAGVNISTGTIENMEGHVLEPKRVVEQALKLAVETVTMILRIDDIIAMSAGDLGAGPTGAGAPPGMGG